MPSVAKAKFCRDAYLKNDTSPETLDKIKSLINDTEVMPWLRSQFLIGQKAQGYLIHCQKTYYLFLFNVIIVVLPFTFLLI